MYFLYITASYELPESELIKDIVYTFQGIDGKWIKFDPSKDAYRIDSQVCLHVIHYRCNAFVLT